MLDDSDDADFSDTSSYDSDDSSIVPPEGLLQPIFSSDEESFSDSDRESNGGSPPPAFWRRRRNALIVNDTPSLSSSDLPILSIRRWAGPDMDVVDLTENEDSSTENQEVTTPNINEDSSSNTPEQQATMTETTTSTVEGQEDLLAIAESRNPIVVLENRSNIPSTSSKRKLSSPKSDPSPKKAKETVVEEEEDADCCPICFEPWSNSGKHRLASLKCGHLFGQKCIERWVKDALKCPQCNTKAKKSDIRVLYAKRLKAVDTTDLTKALSDCEKERVKRRNKEMELAQVRLQYQMAIEECKRLKSQIEDMKNSQFLSALENALTDNINSSQGEPSTAKKFCHVKKVVISQCGNCRVMDFHAESLSLAISQPSPHSSFMPGFGLKKFSVADMKSTQFIIMHSKPIKDVSFSPHGPLLLTASQDQTLKITSLGSNAVVHTYKPQRPVWCCCWDQTDPNLLYAGLSNGSMTCYDTRSTTEALYTIPNPRSSCPIVSIYNIPEQSDPHTPGGLLVQTLQGVTFWQNTGEVAEYRPNYLALEPGNCAGLKYSKELNQCLVSYRPGRSYNCSTHLLCQLQFNDDPADGDLNDSMMQGGVTSQIVDSFYGSQQNTLLTRNALFSTQSGTNFVCIGDEAKKTVNIYDIKSRGSSLLQSLSCNTPALDIAPMEVNERQLLATLTEKELKIYEQK